MSTENGGAKPVRQIDRFGWRPELSLLTNTDREYGLNIIRCTLPRQDVAYYQSLLLESLYVAKETTNVFIAYLISQPK